MSLFITETMPLESTVGDALILIEKLSRKHGWELDDLLVEGPIGFIRMLRLSPAYFATPVRADGHTEDHRPKDPPALTVVKPA